MAQHLDDVAADARSAALLSRVRSAPSMRAVTLAATITSNGITSQRGNDSVLLRTELSLRKPSFSAT